MLRTFTILLTSWFWKLQRYVCCSNSKMEAPRPLEREELQKDGSCSQHWHPVTAHVSCKIQISHEKSSQQSHPPGDPSYFLKLCSDKSKIFTQKTDNKNFFIKASVQISLRVSMKSVQHATTSANKTTMISIKEQFICWRYNQICFL